jgi:hypothetical protein
MNNSTQGWLPYAKARDFTIEPGGLLVRFADGRSHRLRVIEQDNTWLLRGLVVRHARLEFDQSPALAAALKNRHYFLCGLRVDEKDRLIAECHVPKPGLSAAEFQLQARHLAGECDRLEYLITGRDREARMS